MGSRNLIGGLLVGTSIGVAIGLLLAPASGEKTKKKLLRACGKLVEKANGTLKGSLHSLKENYNDVVNETARKGKEILSAGAEKIKV